MSKQIKAIISGLGSSGRVALKAMVDQGVDVIGAIGNRNNIGRDIGEVAGIEPLGVILENDATAVLDRCKDADIVVLASTANEMPDLEGMLADYVSRGINVVTVCGQPYYPWAYDTTIADRLDTLARENGVTILGTGIEDPFWHQLAIVLTSAVTDVREIRITNTALLEMQGPACLDLCFAGKSEEEFRTIVNEGNPEPTAFLPTLMCLARDLGLHITDREFEMEPLIAKTDISYPQYGSLFIPKGKLAGMMEHLAFDTEEGIRLVGDFRAKVAEEGDTGASVIEIDAHPSLVNVTENIAGEYTTGMAMVSRIPDVINAEPGFVTVADLPRPTYHARPLPNYVA